MSKVTLITTIICKAPEMYTHTCKNVNENMLLLLANFLFAVVLSNIAEGHQIGYRKEKTSKEFSSTKKHFTNAPYNHRSQNIPPHNLRKTYAESVAKRPKRHSDKSLEASEVIFFNQKKEINLFVLYIHIIYSYYPIK